MEEREAGPELSGLQWRRRWRPRGRRFQLADAPNDIPARKLVHGPRLASDSRKHYDSNHDDDNDYNHPNYAAVQRSSRLEQQQQQQQQQQKQQRRRQRQQSGYRGRVQPNQAHPRHRTATRSHFARPKPARCLQLRLHLQLLLMFASLQRLAAPTAAANEQWSRQHNDPAAHNSSSDFALVSADYDNIIEELSQQPATDQMAPLASAGRLLTSHTGSTWSLLVAALVQFEPETGAFVQVQWANVLLALVLVLLMVTTAVGNLFVIVAILIERNLRIVGNYLVLSLAIADLLVALLVMPLASIYQILHQWTLGLLLCDIWTSADVFCCTASILHLLAIALDRYWAVTRVNYIRCQRNERRILFMIMFVWLTSSVISLAPVLGWKDDKFEWRLFNEKECLLSQDIGYQLFATSTTFYFPVTLTLIFYWKIYQVARKRIRRKLGNRVKVALQQPSSTSSGSSPSGKPQAAATGKHQLQSVPATMAPPLKSTVVEYAPSSRAGAANFSTSIQRDCVCLCHSEQALAEPEGQRQSADDKKSSEDANRVEASGEQPGRPEDEDRALRKLSACELNSYMAPPVQCIKCKRMNQMVCQQGRCALACFKHRSSSASRNLGSSLASCSRASSLAACVALPPARAPNAPNDESLTNGQGQQQAAQAGGGGGSANSQDGSLDDSSLMQISARSYNANGHCNNSSSNNNGSTAKEAQQSGAESKSQNASESNLNGLIECDCCVCDFCDVNLNGPEDEEMAADYEAEAGERDLQANKIDDDRLSSDPPKQMAGANGGAGSSAELNRVITFHERELVIGSKRPTSGPAWPEPASIQENGLVRAGKRAREKGRAVNEGGASSRFLAICWRRLVAIQQGARRLGRRQNSLQPTLESSATFCDEDEREGADQQHADQSAGGKRHLLLVGASGENNCDHTTVLMSQPLAEATQVNACKLCACTSTNERPRTPAATRPDVAFDLKVSLRNQPSNATASSNATQLELERADAQTGGQLNKTKSREEPSSVVAVAVSSAQIAVSTTVRQVDLATGKVRVTKTPDSPSFKSQQGLANNSVSLQNHAANMESVESKRERKAFKTLAIITGVFVMCWLPFFIIALARPLLDFQPSEWFQGFTLWLGYFNSMLNPIIYTIFSPDFRKAFKRLLCSASASSRSPGNSRSKGHQQQHQQTSSNRSRAGQTAGGASRGQMNQTITSDNRHSPGAKARPVGNAVSKNWNGNEQVERSKNAVVHDFV